MKEKLLSAVIVTAFLAMTGLAAATTLVGPGINNGSFENPAESGNWNIQQDDPAFTFWRGGTGNNPFNSAGNGRMYLHTLPDAYTLAAFAGDQLLNLSNDVGGSAGMFPGFMASDVIQTPIPAGTSLTLSTAFGFNPSAIQARSTGWGGYLGQAMRLYEVNPANFGTRNMILELVSQDTTAPAQGTWRTLSTSVNMPTNGWYLQLELEVGDLDGNLVTDSSDPGYDFSWHMLIDNVVLLCTASDPHILAVTPPVRFDSSAAAGTTFDVSNNGSAGGMIWTAAVTSGGTWLSISGGLIGSDAGTITADFTENTGAQRSGEITVTAAGATDSPKVVTVTQGAQIPSSTVKVLIDEDNTLWNYTGGVHNNLGDHEHLGGHLIRLGEMAANEEKYYPILRAKDIVAQLQAAGVVDSSQIYSAGLNVYISGYEQNYPGWYAVTIHRLTSDWVEGTANWVVQAGSSDWFHRIHDTAAWNTPGGDIGPPLGYQDFYGSTTDLELIQFTGLEDAVRHWFDNPSENYGVQIRMDMITEYVWGTSQFGQTAFYSSESVHGGYPEFEVGFTPLAADCEQMWQDGLGIDVDLNRDCYVDFNDLWLLIGQWLTQVDPSSFAP
jgi:hypothetical protein